MCDFIKDEVHATGVYVGKVEKQKKPVQDTDSENAHIDETAPMIIRYTGTSKDHLDLLFDKRVKADELISYSIFKPKVENKEDPEKEVPLAEQPLNTLKEVYVPEVVREPKIKFYRVPRLGCYFALALQFQSYLHEDFLDKALENYYITMQKIDEQNKAKAEKEEEIKREKEEKEEAGEEYVPPQIEWEKIEEPPYDNLTENYLFCLDTLGQDREFSEKEKEFIRNILSFFSNTNERKEKEFLEKDKLARVESKRLQDDFIENQYQEIQDQMANDAEEKLTNTEIEIDEDNREMYKSFFYNNELKNKLISGPLNDQLKNLVKYRIIKYKKIFQALFYLLGYKKEDICEQETNMLMWKKAHKLVDSDLFKKIEDYQMLGEKIIPDIKKYSKLNHIESLINDYEIEEVQKYSLSYSLLLKWIKEVISIRKQDIKMRKERREKQVEERNQLVEQENERLKKKEEELQAAIEEAKEEWKQKEEEAKLEEKQEEPEEEDIYHYLDDKKDNVEEEKKDEKKNEFTFNEDEFKKHFDEENPPVEIPPEIKEEKDDDFENS